MISGFIIHRRHRAAPDPPPPPPPPSEFTWNGVAPLYAFCVMGLDDGDLAFSKVGQSIPDPAGYYGGRKQPKVRTFGRASRQMSSMQGGLSRFQMESEFDDTDGYFTTLQASGVKFEGRPIAYYFYDEITRQAQGEPLMYARGRMREPSRVSGFGLRVTVQDTLWELLQVEIPKRRISAKTFTGLGTENGRIPITPEGRPVPIVGGLFTGDQTSDKQNRNWIPLIPLDEETIGIQTYGRLLASGDSMSVTKLRVGDELRVIDGASSHPDFLVPGKFRWLAAGLGTKLTRRINGEDYFIIYVRAGSQAWIDALAGKVEICIAGTGFEDVGDGSGTPILTAPLQGLHLLQQYIFGNKTIDTPAIELLWGNGDPTVDERSFTDVDAVHQASGVKGYRTSFLLNDLTTASTVLADLMRSGQWGLFQTSRGTLKACTTPIFAFLNSIVADFQHKDMRAGFSVDTRYDEHWNEVIYSYGQQYTGQKGMSRKNASYVDNLGVGNAKRKITSHEFSYPYLQESEIPSTAATLALDTVTGVSSQAGVRRVAFSFGDGYHGTPISKVYAEITVPDLGGGIGKRILVTNAPVSADPAELNKTVWMMKSGSVLGDWYVAMTIANTVTSFTLDKSDAQLFYKRQNGFERALRPAANALLTLMQSTRPPHAPHIPLTSIDAISVDVSQRITVTHPDGPVAGGYVIRNLVVEGHTVDPDAFTVDLDCVDVDRMGLDINPVTESVDVSWTNGEITAPPQPVKVADPTTGTGPVIGPMQPYPIGGLADGGETAASAGVFQELTRSTPQPMTREQLGRRVLKLGGPVSVEGGADLTIAVFRVGAMGSDVGSQFSTNSSTPVYPNLEFRASNLAAGDGHRYAVKWKVSDTANKAFIPGLQLEIY